MLPLTKLSAYSISNILEQLQDDMYTEGESPKCCQKWQNLLYKTIEQLQELIADDSEDQPQNRTKAFSFDQEVEDDLFIGNREEVFADLFSIKINKCGDETASESDEEQK